ncbi:MAG: hypothetical protein ACNA8W_08310, partial [Bradymonadaceae bacterium]
MFAIDVAHYLSEGVVREGLDTKRRIVNGKSSTPGVDGHQCVGPGLHDMVEISERIVGIVGCSTRFIPDPTHPSLLIDFDGARVTSDVGRMNEIAVIDVSRFCLIRQAIAQQPTNG